MTKPLQKSRTDAVRLTLTRRDVREDTTEPSDALVSRVTLRLVRDRSTPFAPGFVLLEGTLSLLGSPARVKAFQRNLMSSLLSTMEDCRPHALQTRGLRSLLRPEERRRTRKPCNGDITVNDNVEVSGLESFRFLHGDTDSQLFVSLCYHDVRDIRGGDPRLLDLRDLQRADRFDIRRLVQPHPAEEYLEGEAAAGPGHYVARLRPAYAERGRQKARAFTDLSYRQMPILVFSNRIEEGILHGATDITATGPRPRRRVRYVSIGKQLA